MGYSGAGVKLINEKNQEQKISWHCPFKEGVTRDFQQFLFMNQCPLGPFYNTYYIYIYYNKEDFCKYI